MKTYDYKNIALDINILRKEALGGWELVCVSPRDGSGNQGYYVLRKEIEPVTNPNQLTEEELIEKFCKENNKYLCTYPNQEFNLKPLLNDFLNEYKKI